MYGYEEIWRFQTANCAVIFSVAPECDSPENHFDDPEIVAAIDAGKYAWFSARVTVEKHGIEIGADYLACCAYDSPADFCTGDNRNGYFRDMVSEAIADARKTLAKLCDC